MTGFINLITLYLKTILKIYAKNDSKYFINVSITRAKLWAE